MGSVESVGTPVVDLGQPESSTWRDMAPEECEVEPIHCPGRIQPHGVLMALTEPELILRQASDNLELLFGVAARDALGQPLAHLIGAPQADNLRRLNGLGEWRSWVIAAVELPGRPAGGTVDAQISRAGNCWLVEIERPGAADDSRFDSLPAQCRDVIWQLESLDDLGGYIQQLVDQVRRLSGYDRVLIYRFDSNWDGDVIAESRSGRLESFLGKRFPAADMPAQARRLSVLKPVQLVVDLDAVPVPLVSAAPPDSEAPLDLTYAAFRQMSPMHLEYLRNMGVSASMSISLMQGGKLWGLIICHHPEPYRLPLRARELFEFIGRMASLKLSSLESARQLALQERVSGLLAGLTERIRNSADPIATLVAQGDDVMELVHASGAAVVVDGTRHRLGRTPNEVLLVRLEHWLRVEGHAGGLYETADLSAGFPAAISSDVAGGMLAVSLDGRYRNYLAWFRPQSIHTYTWAGRPQKSQPGPDGQTSPSPRKSFESWVEIRRGASEAWLAIERDAAQGLALVIRDLLNRRAQESRDRQYQLLAENSTDIIAQLDGGGVLRFVSAAFEAQLGYPTASVIGHPLTDYIVAADRSLLGEALDGLTTEAPYHSRIVRFATAGGRALWMECRLRRHALASGCAEIVLNARDVTQHYTYQRAIEDMHRRHAMVLEVSSEGGISLDENGMIVYANEKASVILGYEPGELVGENCSRLMGERDPSQRAHSPRWCVLADGPCHEEPLRRLSTAFAGRNGRKVAVDYVCTRISQSRREGPGGCVLVFSDQTEKLRRITEERHTTETIMDYAAEAVVVTDAKTSILSVNRAFTQITGYSAEEAVGQTPRLLSSGLHTPHFYRDMWAALHNRRHWAGEIWNRRKNGEIYPQWGNITAILDGEGKVRNYVAIFSDISKAKQAEERLYYLANHDGLTGLPNRSYFMDHLARSIDQARRTESQVAIIFIDLDRFKIINDTLGHAIGDLFLKAVAARITSTCRQQDVICRWGGDEFVLFLENCARTDIVATLVRRILDTVSQPLEFEGHELCPTVSIGVALFPSDGDTVNDLIKNADAAMYRAKEKGRNNFEFFTEQLAGAVRTKFDIGTDLRHAARRNQLVLHYQPQFEVAEGRVVGLEALVRWNHPERGLLFPVHFIPLAEELGMIGLIGDWVLQEACRQVAEWRQSVPGCPPVAINVAPNQLGPGFVDRVIQCLEDWGLPARMLELEITESALAHDHDVAAQLNQLRDRGISLAIDDFGTGYSSLAKLKHFPFTALKIDKCFVDGLPDGTHDLAIVKTIVALAQSLKVRLVAEGVERVEQFELLRSLGVHAVQGYYFSKPVTSQIVAAMLEAF